MRGDSADLIRRTGSWARRSKKGAVELRSTTTTRHGTHHRHLHLLARPLSHGRLRLGQAGEIRGRRVTAGCSVFDRSILVGDPAAPRVDVKIHPLFQERSREHQ